MSNFDKNNNESAEREDKLPDVGLMPQSEGEKKLENFWYYNKWKIAVVAFILAILLICGFQMCENSKVDSYVVYAGSYPMLNSTVYSGMVSAFESVLPYDLTDDGVKEVQLIKTYILSEEQIESLNAVTDENGNKEYSADIGFNIQELERFDNLIMAGEYSVCLLEPWLYSRVKNNGGFVSLSEVFDELPAEAIDEYGIKFSETEFAKYYSVFEALPEDTILCLRKPSTFFGGNDADSKEYKMSYDLFCAIVEFIPQ